MYLSLARNWELDDWHLFGKNHVLATPMTAYQFPCANELVHAQYDGADDPNVR